MLTDYSILMISNDSEQDSALALVLEFMGAQVTHSQVDDWQSHMTKTLSAIIINSHLAPVELDKIFTTISTGSTNALVLAHGLTTHKEHISEQAGALLQGYISHPLRQPQIMQLLQSHQKASSTNTNDIPVLFKHTLKGCNPAITHVHEMIEKVADSNTSVLILGESGTGKEVVARSIHEHSVRKDKPFIPVNCGAIPAELLESELFGHEKGAFTGAISQRKGRFELAQGGTLFLDEIGDMPLAMQVKLLRILQEHCFERIGSNKSISTDVRIIAATHRDVEGEISKGTFREDLYYRLNVFPIEMPALRDRLDDLPILIDELSNRIEQSKGVKIQFLPRALSALAQYQWPGNVRELANLVERMAILSPGGLIDLTDLPAKFISQENLASLTSNDKNEVPDLHQQAIGAIPYLPEEGIDLKEHLVMLERYLIEQALVENNGVVARAAGFLKMRRTTLVEKMRKYGMNKYSHDQAST